ncbi:hypothetical protein FPQ18DRAFT_236389, partial [Pyronema domesticum]
EKVMEWIPPLEPHKRHKDVKSKWLEKTGVWFLEAAEFKAWCDGDGSEENFSTVLGCYGIPGAGKSVMSSLVIDELSEKLSKDGKPVCMAYFYCDCRDEANQTAINIIGALLKQ